MKRTYVDAGVLIAAARGQASIAVRAFEILDDPDREFAASVFLKLEVLPKAVYHNNSSEVEFYEEFFSAVTSWANDLNTVADHAYQQACDAELAALDALHVAAAVSVGAEELVTSEKPDKPLFRIQSINVVSIWHESIRCEEELLAYYLRRVDENGDHNFTSPSGYGAWRPNELVILEGGLWDGTYRHPQYLAKKVEGPWPEDLSRQVTGLRQQLNILQENTTRFTNFHAREYPDEPNPAPRKT